MTNETFDILSDCYLYMRMNNLDAPLTERLCEAIARHKGESIEMTRAKFTRLVEDNKPSTGELPEIGDHGRMD